ncbi:Creatinase/aminopeptidase [Gonapodya prolifera JEL478]|uniref:Creatinase/aminopeptidase n=1 Tax=Gonapodya prolifera (strain JEL478) TaxID=1344416 RepID=A0A139A1L0_GONPJ|nr:Creatinase/aminopeptidase [Gonapodya prolifera JEL478]|eukprot:KXS10425.1 Creatinase/aminopeptidase [Gonapodya prolifera JEL478]
MRALALPSSLAFSPLACPSRGCALRVACSPPHAIPSTNVHRLSSHATRTENPSSAPPDPHALFSQVSHTHPGHTSLNSQAHRPLDIPLRLAGPSPFPDAPAHLGGSGNGDSTRFSFALSRARTPTRDEEEAERSIFERVGPIGQPSWGTHPHLIRPGEITPGITRAEYRQRRENLMASLPSGSVALIGGYGVRYQSGAGVFYPFKQNADMFYFSGVDEPDTALVLVKPPSSTAISTHLFVRPPATLTQMWDGPRAGLGCAPHFGVDRAHSIGSLQDFLQSLLEIHAREGAPLLLYTDLDVRVVREGERAPSPDTAASSSFSFSASTSTPTSLRRPIPESYSITAPSASQRLSIFSQHVRDLVLRLPASSGDALRRSLTATWWGAGGMRTHAPGAAHVVHRSLRPYAHEVRLFKSEAELRIMKRAGDVTAHGFTAALRYLETVPLDAHHSRSPSAGTYHDAPHLPPTESALESTFHHHCQLAGSPRPSYVPVVASGRNALTMHYVANNATLNPGDLVLMDMGCEFGGYASDVTRTWMVGGWNARGAGGARRRLVEAVRRVQEGCIQRCTERDDLSLDDLHTHAVQLVQRELEPILGRPVPKRECDTLFPHHLSHWLGIDVHDTSAISRSRKLRAGMVVTVEPGIYIPDEPGYPADLRGVGVRVEDDVAVMPEGPAWVLSGRVLGKV